MSTSRSQSPTTEPPSRASTTSSPADTACLLGRAGRRGEAGDGPTESGCRGRVVDVLFASSGIEPEIVRSAEAIEILPGLVVPVARTGHLIALKLLARDDESRPQDLADLRSLHEVATL